MANRLARSTSPYLQQHADNPVDWWEWGPDAFAEARRRDVPVLLSVGYAACHWCHVMAHESFEDESIGALLSDGFVAVKVDREERPDVDAVYMSVTSALTGHGGWPMTCLLTPEAEPFWAGTYLPRDRFEHLLRAVGEQWRTDAGRLRDGARHIVSTLRDAQTRAPTLGVPSTTAAGDEGTLAAAVQALAAEYDSRSGGFGGAPKFPPSMVLAFLLRHHARTGEHRALEMVRGTCEAMARSGTYDQLGGGFARYAVDRDWVVPHFEKMLYDNALLLGVYTDLARADATARPWAERVVRETVEWLLQDMWTEQEAFASSLDADTDGEEGLTYVWTPHQLRQALGEQDGERAATLLEVTETGTFEHGASTLQLHADPDDQAWWSSVRERLHLTRTLRPQPGRDDKVVTAWNGLLISSLATAGWAFEEPDWVDVAARCARFLLRVHVVHGRLRRSSRDGVVGPALAVAEDHGNLVDGLLALHRATGDESWLRSATDLLEGAVNLFGEPDGTFSATGHDAEALVLTPSSRGDNAEPGGLSSLVLALVRHGAQAGSSTHLDAAAAALRGMEPLITGAPRFAGWALVAAEELAAGPVLVRLSAGTEPGDPLGDAARNTPVGTLVVDGDPATPAREGRRAATVCRGTVCGLPFADPSGLPS